MDGVVVVGAPRQSLLGQAARLMMKKGRPSLAPLKDHRQRAYAGPMHLVLPACLSVYTSLSVYVITFPLHEITLSAGTLLQVRRSTRSSAPAHAVQLTPNNAAPPGFASQWGRLGFRGAIVKDTAPAV